MKVWRDILISVRKRIRRLVASEPAILGGIALAIAVLLALFGPPGTDYAAHVYQKQFFATHGFALWNNLWYAGRYSFITYSTLYYPVAAVVGIRPLAILCTVVGVIAWWRLVTVRFGEAGRWSARCAAVVIPAFLLTGALPFLLGFVLGLTSLMALQHGRWWLYAVLFVLAAAASPLAFALTAVLIAGLAIADRWDGRRIARALSVPAAVGAALLALTAVFPSEGHDPFPLPALLTAIAVTGLLAALAWNVPGARALLWVALVQIAADLVSFTVPSNVGEGITRLQFVALPAMLLAAGLRHWRPRALIVVALAAAAYWNGAPLVRSFEVGVSNPAATPSYWEPAIRYLHRHLSPQYRVEVVDTLHHWPAAWLPEAGVPLARGWFRQDDFPQNRLLYGSRLTGDRYVRWLRDLGVEYVVLADVAPDYSARTEAALVADGLWGLKLVAQLPHQRIYAVTHPLGIVTGPGPARVVSYGTDRVRLWIGAPGTYRIALRSSPYWLASRGCLTKGSDGMLRLHAATPGVYRIRFAVRAPVALDTLLGTSPASAC